MQPAPSSEAPMPREAQSLAQRVLADPFLAVADYYAGCLAKHERAMRFATEELGLSAEQTSERRIGFADRSLGTQLPHRRVREGREVREQLVALGLYKANGRETLRGYVTEPIVDQQGQVVGIRGHKLDPATDGPESIIVGGKNRMRYPVAGVRWPGRPYRKPVTRHRKPIRKPVRGDDLTISDGEIIFTRDDRRYRIRGLEKNTSTTQLKVNLMASRQSLVHLDALDLVKARSRASFIKAAASELYVDEETIKKDIGQLLLKLETLQADRIEKLKSPTRVEVVLTDEEKQAALELLKDPQLLDRVTADLQETGIVGEPVGKLAGYLAAISRKLPSPLALLIQSSTSAGKTSLMDGVLALVPEEDLLRLSNLSGQALYYLESDGVRHKILAISEDQGLGQAAYALKLLQSEGVLRHATVTKGENGRMTTERYSVEGPVSLFLTTTAVELDEELMNRCLVVSVDESREQTRAILQRQRQSRTLAAQQAALDVQRIRRLHQNAQRLIEPLRVCNPYADQLTFASSKTRLRRDHAKYLTLIDSVALLHQHQREIHTVEVAGEVVKYINVTPMDIRIANQLAGELLGRSLDDLSPQTRAFLLRLEAYVREVAQRTDVPRDAVRFTRRDVRQATLWSEFQVRTHLAKLVELEYVLPHRGKNGRRYVYELLYDGAGASGQPFLTGLIDPNKLAAPAPPAPIPPTLSIETATLSPA